MLLRTTNAAFTQLIPLLLLFSTLLSVFGPDLTRAVRARRTGTSVDSPVGFAAQFAIAVYGGSFGKVIHRFVIVVASAMTASYFWVTYIWRRG